MFRLRQDIQPPATDAPGLTKTPEVFFCKHINRFWNIRINAIDL
jgi:hypothetical protein